MIIISKKKKKERKDFLEISRITKNKAKNTKKLILTFQTIQNKNKLCPTDILMPILNEKYFNITSKY